MTVATIAPAALDPHDDTTWPVGVFDTIGELLDIADNVDAISDPYKWTAARLIVEQITQGKKQTEIAESIGRSKAHVTFMKKAWEAWAEFQEDNPDAERPLFADAYRLAKKPRVIKGKVEPEPITMGPFTPAAQVIQFPAPHALETPEQVYPGKSECECGDQACEECSSRMALEPSTPELWVKYADMVSETLLEMYQTLGLTDTDWREARKYLKDLVGHRLGDKLHKTMPVIPDFSL